MRATDENVPRALSGYRPRVSGEASAGVQASRASAPGGEREAKTLFPREASITVDQNLFNGFRTTNSVRQAESQVLGAREALRNLEQTVLLDAATAYMDVLRDTAVLNLQRNNVEVLEEQVSQTTQRFAVGEVTRTDVAQAEARLQAGRAQTSLAEACSTFSFSLRKSWSTVNRKT